MSSHESEPTLDTRQTYEDEIDLRRILGFFASWWREILLVAITVTVLAVLSIIILERISAPSYSATADVIIARVASEISLDERMQTVVDDLGGASRSTSYRAALLELARNDELAVSVIEDMGYLLPDHQRTPEKKKNSIDVRMPFAQDGRTPSDILQFTATADSPELATEIVNSWATQYIENVNALYGEVPSDAIETLRDELIIAEDTYRTAQLEYVSFLSESKRETFSRQLRENIALRDALEAGRTQTIAAIQADDQTTKLAYFLAMTEVQRESTLQVFTEQAQARSIELSRLYQARNFSRQQLDQADNLMTSIEAGGNTAFSTNAIALQLLKAQVFSSISEPIYSVDGMEKTNIQRIPADIIVSTESLGTVSTEEQLRDVKGLISALTEYIDDIDNRISVASYALVSDTDYLFLDRLNTPDSKIATNLTGSYSQTASLSDAETLDEAIARQLEKLLAGDTLIDLLQADILSSESEQQSPLLTETENKLQELISLLEAEGKKDQYLQHKRDLAWETYDAMSNKAAEMRLKLSAADSQVRIGSLAIPPSVPNPGQSLLQIGVLSFSVGLLLGVVIAFVSSYLGKIPLLRRKKSVS